MTDLEIFAQSLALLGKTKAEAIEFLSEKATHAHFAGEFAGVKKHHDEAVKASGKASEHLDTDGASVESQEALDKAARHHDAASKTTTDKKHKAYHDAAAEAHDASYVAWEGEAFGSGHARRSDHTTAKRLHNKASKLGRDLGYNTNHHDDHVTHHENRIDIGYFDNAR